MRGVRQSIGWRGAASALLLAALAGCGSVSDQFGHSVWVEPGKYIYHDCGQIQRIDGRMVVRKKELEELMERAAQGPGGQVIGQLTYRTEYQQVLGDRAELARAFTEKRCHSESVRASERSVF